MLLFIMVIVREPLKRHLVDSMGEIIQLVTAPLLYRMKQIAALKNMQIPGELLDIVHLAADEQKQRDQEQKQAYDQGKIVGCQIKMGGAVVGQRD